MAPPIEVRDRSWPWWIALVWIACGTIAAQAQSPSSSAPAGTRPFRDHRSQPLEHHGPGRDTPAPSHLAEVRIGYFGPDDPMHPTAGGLWCAATLAIEQANQQGGYNGKPFRLVARWSDDPWSGGAAKVTQMVYEDQVWAILGGIDGPTTHVAEQVATKAWLPIVCAASSDRTSHSAMVPWMFSLLPGDPRQAPMLVREIARATSPQTLVVLASEDHDSRRFLAELNRSLSAQGLTPQFQFTFRESDQADSQLLHRTMAVQPTTVLLIADARSSGQLVRQLRAAGFAGTIVGGPSCGRRAFLEEAQTAAKGVLFPLLQQSGPGYEKFVAAYRTRFQQEPDFAASNTYDAARLLVAAIDRGGLNRVRIRDALRQLSPWEGVAGRVQWDPLGGNTRPAQLATIIAGDIRVPVIPQQDKRKDAAQRL